MFSALKGYLVAAGAAAIFIFAAIFKYRGNKIENLEVELEVEKTKAKVAKKVADNENEVSAFEAANKEAAKIVDKRDIDEINKHFFSI